MNAEFRTMREFPLIGQRKKYWAKFKKIHNTSSWKALKKFKVMVTF